MMFIINEINTCILLQKPNVLCPTNRHAVYKGYLVSFVVPALEWRYIIVQLSLHLYVCASININPSVQPRGQVCFSQTLRATVFIFEPAHIIALFVLRKFILQTHMGSHPVWLDVSFLVRPFVYFHISCVQTAKALSPM